MTPSSVFAECKFVRSPRTVGLRRKRFAWTKSATAALFGVMTWVSITGCGQPTSTPGSDSRANPVSETTATRQPASSSAEPIDKSVPSQPSRLERAEAALDAKDFSEARAFAIAELLEDPENSDAAWLMARLESQKGDGSRAIEFADRVRIESRHGLAAVEFSVRRLRQSDRREDAAERLRSAIDRCISLRLDADDPKLTRLRHQAWRLCNELGMRIEASQIAEDLCRAGMATPEELASLVRRGMAFPFNVDEEAAAESTFGSPLALARWHYDRERPDDALEALGDFAIEDSPPPVAAFASRLWAETQRSELWKSWFASADAVVRDHTDTWAGWGIVLFDDGHYEASVRALLEAVYRDPTDRLSVQRLSRSLAAVGRQDDSKQFAFRGIQLSDSERLAQRFLEARLDRSIASDLARITIEMERPFEALGWAKHAAGSGGEADRIALQRMRLASDPRTRQLSRETGLLGVDREIFELKMDDFVTARSNAVDPAKRLHREDVFVGSDEPMTDFRFEDVAEALGLQHQYFKDTEIDLSVIPIHESLGGGIGVLDYDLDGWPDLYLAQGSCDPPRETGTRSSELFRNRTDRFVRATESSGASDRHYSTGVSCGDINADGFVDLYMAALGKNRLLINNGDGTFSDRSEWIDGEDHFFTSSVAIADLTGDGLADLFEANYIEMDGGFDLPSRDASGRYALPSPLMHYPESDRWFANAGDGTFTRHVVSADHVSPATSLGLLIADFDGRPGNEVFVANDVRPNHLLHLSADKPPRNTADTRGLGRGFRGTPNGCMGVAAGDFDRDGTLDLHITNYFEEPANHFLGQPDGSFRDSSVALGLATMTVSNVGFGTKAIDIDRNGWLDFAVLNGHVFDMTDQGQPMRMFPQLIRGSADQCVLVEERALGRYGGEPNLGRSLATGDFDLDGRIDMVATHLDRPTALLRNQTLDGGNHLQFELVGRSAERGAIGSVVEVPTDQGVFKAFLTGGGGYLASDQPIVDVGLGRARIRGPVVIRWPDGSRQTVAIDELGVRYLIIQDDPQPWRREKMVVADVDSRTASR